MPDITAIAQAFGALKAMKDIAETMIGLRDATAFRERQIEFQGKIIDAQSALSALQDERSSLIERVSALEKEVTGLKKWGADKEKYQLQAVSGLGSLAYMLKPDARGSEPPHWLCTQCYENRKKSIMQPHASAVQYSVWKCPECENSFHAYSRERPAWSSPA